MATPAKTILVVDSDEDMCWLLKKVFKQQNCQVIISHTWENTRQLVSQKSPDLLLLDMPLNNISASDTLKYIRSLQPNTPVVVIIPYGNERLLNRIKELGNFEFIAKPFVIENLVQTVKQALCLS